MGVEGMAGSIWQGYAAPGFYRSTNEMIATGGARGVKPPTDFSEMNATRSQQTIIQDFSN